MKPSFKGPRGSNRALGGLELPHLTQQAPAGDNLYIIMEYASDGDLSQVIKSGKQMNSPLPEDALWRYLIMTCKGLQHLHEHKILHRCGVQLWSSVKLRQRHSQAKHLKSCD